MEIPFDILLEIGLKNIHVHNLLTRSFKKYNEYYKTRLNYIQKYFTTIETKNDPSGLGNWIEYRLNGVLHNPDGPAIKADGYQEYRIFGKKHRTDGPAIIFNDGEIWYENDLRHRQDGPAVISPRSQERWLFGYYLGKN